MLGRRVPDAYLVDLKATQASRGSIDPTGCPDHPLAVGRAPPPPPPTAPAAGGAACADRVDASKYGTTCAESEAWCELGL